MDYENFIKQKAISAPPSGFDAMSIKDCAKNFQRDVISWACKRGRSALFAGTGLGKTFMQLSWANEVYESKAGKTLIFTPLAVTPQTIKEADKFGMEAIRVASCSESNAPIQVTNYHKMDNFDLSKYAAVVLDESSILKNESGKFRNQLIDRCKDIPFRLAATATPSPNDYMELGNHAQFCGIMSYTDMLSTFFVHDAAKTQDWRLKGHAESEFWKWMASWACMFTHPRDIGYDDDGYDLPTLHQHQHIVDVEYNPSIDTGMLFPLEAQTMGERLAARRATIEERAAKAAEIANDSKDAFVIWCNLNTEGDKLCELIPDAVQVSGADSDEKKEEKIVNFSNGNIRVLVTKPSICGAGMNWQHCHNTIFVGLNDSFEQVYQAIRRFWRFGQKNEVHAHFIASELEGAVVANIKRKEAQAEHMMQQMVAHMADLTSASIKGAVRESAPYNANDKMEIPSWI